MTYKEAMKKVDELRQYTRLLEDLLTLRAEQILGNYTSEIEDINLGGGLGHLEDEPDIEPFRRALYDLKKHIDQTWDQVIDVENQIEKLKQEFEN